MNRQLAGDFDLSKFHHASRYDAAEGRVEMHLVSGEAQTVDIARLGLRVGFDAGETIHTENSYKYAPEQIDGIAQRAGWRVQDRWLDAARQFSVNLFMPSGESSLR